MSVERNNTDALDVPDSRGVDHSSSGSSNLPWAAFAFPIPSPVPSSPDVAARSELLDSVFALPTSDPPTTTQGARRSTYSGISSRTMSAARTSANASSASSG